MYDILNFVDFCNSLGFFAFDDDESSSFGVGMNNGVRDCWLMLPTQNQQKCITMYHWEALEHISMHRFSLKMCIELSSIAKRWSDMNDTVAGNFEGLKQSLMKGTFFGK